LTSYRIFDTIAWSNESTTKEEEKMLAYSQVEEILEPTHRYRFTTVPCPIDSATKVVEVDGEALHRYHQGTSVQVAFPELSPGDREQLFMSHICDPCFHKLFAEEDES
jgi:hypothetical protein